LPRTPLYHRIAHDLRRRITGATCRAAPLPSSRAFANSNSAFANTVVNATTPAAKLDFDPHRQRHARARILSAPRPAAPVLPTLNIRRPFACTIPTATLYLPDEA